SPRITAPTESRSRLSARPNTLFGNSSISPCITSDKPWMRVIPSVTETTVPCVRTSVDAPKPSMRLLSSSLISDGLSCMFRLLESCYPARSGGQSIAHAGQLGLHGRIKYLITHCYAHAANKVSIHRNRRFELEAEFLFQPRHKLLHLIVAERKSAANISQRGAFVLVFQYFELLGNLRQHQNTVVANKQFDEIARLSRQRRFDQACKQLNALSGVEPRIGQRFAYVILACHLCKLGYQT